MLVGTNVHLAEQRAITREEAIQAARRHNLTAFVEVSSKTGQNVEKLFETITKILFDKYRPNIMRYNMRLLTFNVGESITPRLENSNSIIDVGRKIFRQCKCILKKLLKWLTDKIKEKLDSLS